MRLILAALAAAVLGFGAALLFSNYFGTIEIEATEQEPKVRVARDTPTRSRDDELNGLDGGETTPVDPRGLILYCGIGWHPVEGVPKGSKFVKHQTLSRPYPVAPVSAFKDGRDHYVAGNYDIEATGNTSNFRIATSHPTDLWNRSVISALSKWEFRPATVDGVAVKIHGCYFDFRLTVQDHD